MKNIKRLTVLVTLIGVSMISAYHSILDPLTDQPQDTLARNKASRQLEDTQKTAQQKASDKKRDAQRKYQEKQEKIQRNKEDRRLKNQMRG